LMLYVYLLCRKKGWGKTDGEGKLPFVTALLDLAVIAIGVGLLLVGNKIIGPAIFGSSATDARADRMTDLIGIILFAGYFIVLSLVPKFRTVLNGRAAYALMMPVIILGGIYGGVFTPTEASAVAVIYALFVGRLWRNQIL
jgi:TRAP-type C4-dicarboxylate transport system permease large subunit